MLGGPFGHLNGGRMKRSEVPAVTETEFLSMLESYNLKEAFISNKMACARCGKSISFTNLLGYLKTDSSLSLFCNDVNCKECSNE